MSIDFTCPNCGCEGLHFPVIRDHYFCAWCRWDLDLKTLDLGGPFEFSPYLTPCLGCGVFTPNNYLDGGLCPKCSYYDPQDFDEENDDW